MKHAESRRLRLDSRWSKAENIRVSTVELMVVTLTRCTSTECLPATWKRGETKENDDRAQRSEDRRFLCDAALPGMAKTRRYGGGESAVAGRLFFFFPFAAQMRLATFFSEGAAENYRHVIRGSDPLDEAHNETVEIESKEAIECFYYRIMYNVAFIMDFPARKRP